MLLSKILKVWLSVILLVLSSNSYAAYVNHHYEEKTEEKFVSEYILNSNVVVACYVEYKDFFLMNNPSLKKTLKGCEDSKKILEKLNKVKYTFGRVKGYLPYSKEVIIELIEEKQEE